jgi:AcrR family transcriptional regulator
MTDVVKFDEDRPDRRLAPRLAELRRQAASTAIEHAALKLFAARPSADVTVEEIAAAAGVGERTLYRYFPTKDDILLAYPRRAAAAFGERLRARPDAETPYQALHNTILEPQTEEARSDWRLWMAALLDSSSNERTARLALGFMSGAVSDALAERRGTPTDDLWTSMAGAIAAAAMDVGTRQWISKGGALIDHQLAALATARSSLEHAR